VRLSNGTTPNASIALGSRFEFGANLDVGGWPR